MFSAKKKNLEHVYVPISFLNTFIQLNHDYEYEGHFGIDKTSDLVSINFYLPKIRKDISGYMKCGNPFSSEKEDRNNE